LTPGGTPVFAGPGNPPGLCVGVADGWLGEVGDLCVRCGADSEWQAVSGRKMRMTDSDDRRSNSFDTV
jgi:hypothetical protein